MKHSIININNCSPSLDEIKEHFFSDDALRIAKRRQSLCAYWLAVKMLREEIGEDFRILFKRSGRPFIDGESYNFSISHSGDFAACATGKCRCGIDIEAIRSCASFDRVINRMMSSEETEWINQHESKRDSRFFTLWTMKEAYLKAAELRHIFDIKGLSLVKNGQPVTSYNRFELLTQQRDGVILSVWHECL